jgi:5'-nucleotidase
MQKPIIAVDVDGVVADLDTEWLRRYNELSGDNLTPDKLTRWDIGDQTLPGWKEKFYQLLQDPFIYDEVQPYAYAFASVEWLRMLGRVVFVTSTPAEHLTAKYQWLVRHGFLDRKTGINDYIPIKDKWLVAADVLLDDHVKNVESFKGQAFLITRPHNAQLACSRERIPGVGLARAYTRLKTLFSP